MSVLRFDCRFRYTSGFCLDFAFSTSSRVTALVGPSGCGKTTLLNLVAGLLTPDDGSIVLHDCELFNLKKQINLPPEQRQIGYVFQDYVLFPHLTIKENLQYGQKRSGQTRIKYKQVVDVLELSEVLDRYPVSLSGGQKQRVAVGRALLRSPQLLLLDEPLSALDSDLRTSVAGYLAQAIDASNIPTLLVSHDAPSIKWLAHETIVIRRPEI